jgi:hypothetical protein
MAARETGRNFILIEIETKYVELINNRLNGVVNPKPVKPVKPVKPKKSKIIQMGNPSLLEFT